MDSTDQNQDCELQSLRRAQKQARIRELVRHVEPEVGPGGLFKIAYLGSRYSPLSPNEYRRRQGHRFNSETVAIAVANPHESRACIRAEMRRVMCQEPSVVVRLVPGSRVFLPVLPDYRYSFTDESDPD
jgi:hypothetical protein